MSFILSLTFPHRRYHATPWDQAANSGVVEWPPSPWRMVRALIAVAHTRHPDIPMERVLEAVRPLSGPPTYYLPPTRRGHTRHYMPKSTQRTGENSTQLTFDSYVSLGREDPLLIEWPEVDLSAESRQIVSDLAQSLPYLGRAESAVVVSLADAAPDPEEWVGSMWRPNPHGLHRLMCPVEGVRQEQLEVTVPHMRKGRRLIPEGAIWTAYEEVSGLPPRRPRAVHAGTVEVMRWHVDTKAPFQAVNAILATDRLRMIALSVTKPRADREQVKAEDGHRQPVAGRDGDLLSGHPTEQTRQHQHAHWLWTENEGRVSDLLLWVPARDGDGKAGISYETAARVAAAVSEIGLRPRKDGDYQPSGFVRGDLNFVGWGGQEIIADLVTRPDGVRGGTVWASATPHLLVRRGKRNQSLESLAMEDVCSELDFRFDVPPRVRSVVVESRPREARLYRRLRWGDTMAGTFKKKGAIHDRIPVWLRVEFEQAVEGPLVLGGLSHFGFGRLEPVE